MVEKPEPEKPGRRVVTLRAHWETQEALAKWVTDLGFDLGWDYDGWPQRSEQFNFHVTLVASANAVSIPVGARSINPLTLMPIEFEEMGRDRRVPAIKIKPHDTLTAMRAFFVAAYGAEPTFAEFKPHVSVSYRWSGEPALAALPLPDFPLVFDWLVVSDLPDPVKTRDVICGPRHTATMSDAVTISGTRATSDGYLIADCRAARTGIQDYAGFEIGAEDATRMYRVWRPEGEVFKSDSLASFAHRPVTIGHPTEGVTADTWKKEAVGTIGGEVVRDGGYVRVPLILMDKAAIDLVSGGTREISMGYDCKLDMTAGVTPHGDSYDAIQRDIRINHCAIVEKGRAGPACRIGDRVSTPETHTQKDIPMKTVTVDGRKIEVADDIAAVIEALQAKSSKQSDALSQIEQVLPGATKIVGDLRTELAEKDKALADAVKATDDAKKAIPTAAQIAKMAKDRAALIDAARKIDPDIEVGDEDEAGIRAKVVQAKKGDAAVKDRSADYVAAMFDALLSDAADPDPIRDGLKFGDGGKKLSPRDAYLAGLGQDWRPQTK